MIYVDPSGHAVVWIVQIANDYGYDVEWDPDTKTAVVTRKKNGIEIKHIFKTPIFDGKMYIDDKNFLYTTGEESGTYAERMAASLRTASITIDDIKKASSTKGTGKGEWIPGTVMQLNGTSAEEKALKKWFDNKGIKWEQSKIDAIWQATEEINKQYGIQIDPRFLLAIIIQEGTGSFNTSRSNRAADGQNGIETNYALDLMKANSLIFGKILGYIYYGSEFRQAVSSNNNLSGISGGGDIFQYANWSTPIIRMNTKKVETGVYAGHGAWGSSVRNIYNDLTGGSASNYEQYISGIDKSVAQNIAQSQGIKLPTYKFVASQNSQNSKGKPDGNWTITGQLK